MTDKTKKPELIEDSDLDEASGGLLPATDSSAIAMLMRASSPRGKPAWRRV